MKKRILFGIIISIFFLYLVLRNIDIKTIAEFIVHGNYLWLLPCLVIVTLAFIFRAIRWKFLFLPIRKFTAKQLFSSLLMGFAANCIFPMRFGEVVRAYIVGKKHNVSKSSSLATIVLERIMDGVGILILLGLAVPFLPVFPSWVKRTIFIAIILFIGVLVTVSILIIKKHFIDILKKVPFIRYELKEQIVHKIKKFIIGFEIIKDIRNFLIVIFISICVWICETINIYFLVKIVGINLSFFAIVFVLFVTIIGVMIPAAPGSLGTFEAAFVVGIIFFSTKYAVITNEIAFAAALIIHLFGVFYVMSLGIYYFFKEGISYKEISHAN
ncbi:MAG: lysylphosphatidylglycerol synthase transmembrane domain-containing protein [Elusimicrobiota bacterium]|nr:lysylphosphatidylglycerol synthase transmembrane domain-containing protein [Elusimicrobiota bacterium]